MRKRQERDPGREYMDEIIEALDWWAAVTRPFVALQRFTERQALAWCNSLGFSRSA